MGILYKMPKTYITDTHFLPLSQCVYIYMGRQILAHIVFDTFIHLYTPLECRSVTVYGYMCEIHKHPHVHAQSLSAKGEETSPVKCLASLTIFKIIMGASAI